MLLNDVGDDSVRIVARKVLRSALSKNICIVTPGYIASTPRVVKEADALTGAGFDVRVVFTQGNLERVRAHDEQLLQGKLWRWAAIGWSPQRKGESWLYYKSKLRMHAARCLPPSLSACGRFAEHAEGRVFQELTALAAAERADLYIGHYPAGLAAAAHAARRQNSLLGYDVEDLHTAEQPSGKDGARQTERIRRIESRYLPFCSYVSVVSPLVGEEMSRRYRIPRPVVIHNVFPLSDRAGIDGLRRDRKNLSLPSLYWYSQAIGEGRGIEDAIRAIGLLGHKVELHLRGSIQDEVRNRFRHMASQCGVEEMIYYHPPVPPSQLLSRASEHDIGLALEQPNTLSRQKAVSNKLFFYFLAGLAVVATDVAGQQAVMADSPGVGVLYPPGDYRALANQLEEVITTPGRLEAHKTAALRSAQARWNWELEQQSLVRTVSCLFGQDTPASPRLVTAAV